eukprot:2325196-Rhodomonas_salina.1
MNPCPGHGHVSTGTPVHRGTKPRILYERGGCHDISFEQATFDENGEHIVDTSKYGFAQLQHPGCALGGIKDCACALWPSCAGDVRGLCHLTQLTARLEAHFQVQHVGCGRQLLHSAAYPRTTQDRVSTRHDVIFHDNEPFCYCLELPHGISNVGHQPIMPHPRGHFHNFNSSGADPSLLEKILQNKVPA